MVVAILQAPVLFFDSNPVGRILNRFSNDIGCVDEMLPKTFLTTMQMLLVIFAQILVTVSTNVWLMFLVVPISVLVVFLSNYYLKTARELKRLESISRSPVFAHLSETLIGLDTIRTRGKQTDFVRNEEERMPPKDWPRRGSIVLRDVSLTHYPGGPQVLKNINLSIKGGAKIGVAGRTGAGKSSFVAALMRMPDADGEIIIDGVPIKEIGLQQARRGISVLGQSPVLFSGSLRKNLDILDKFQDADLW